QPRPQARSQGETARPDGSRAPQLPGRSRQVLRRRQMTSTLTDQEFRLKSDDALHALQRALMPLSDREGFEIELQDGVLNVLFEEPSEARFVVSPNAPVRQIWVSAMARGYRLAWSPDQNAFVLDGETLQQLVERLTRQFLRA